MADLHELTALEQAAAVRRREVSPTELVEHYLRRVHDLQAGLGAFVTVTAEPAIAAARADLPSTGHRSTTWCGCWPRRE